MSLTVWLAIVVKWLCGSWTRSLVRPIQINLPDPYKEGMDLKAWLVRLNAYFVFKHIVSPQDQALVLLASLDESCKGQIEHLKDTNGRYNITEMVEFMYRLFSKHEDSAAHYRKLFLNRKQTTPTYSSFDT